MKKSAWLKEFYRNLGPITLSVLIFINVGLLQGIVGRYADAKGYIIIKDPIFNLLPAIKFFGPIFVYGIFLVFAFLFLYPLIYKLKDFPYTLNQLSLLLLIRNGFILLSGLKLPEGAVHVNYPFILNSWNFQNDLFFSGHVAVPLLGFFIFKESKIRWFFLISSIVMGISALLTHLHYTIDILTGIFVAYGSYSLGKWIMK
jgi:hypothetical protein